MYTWPIKYILDYGYAGYLTTLYTWVVALNAQVGRLFPAAVSKAMQVSPRHLDGIHLRPRSRSVLVSVSELEDSVLACVCTVKVCHKAAFFVCLSYRCYYEVVWGEVLIHCLKRKIWATAAFWQEKESPVEGMRRCWWYLTVCLRVSLAS